MLLIVGVGLIVDGLSTGPELEPLPKARRIIVTNPKPENKCRLRSEEEPFIFYCDKILVFALMLFVVIATALFFSTHSNK